MKSINGGGRYRVALRRSSYRGVRRHRTACMREIYAHVLEGRDEDVAKGDDLDESQRAFSRYVPQCET